MTAKDAEYARKIALEEERRMKNRQGNGGDEEMAYKLSEAEKIKLKKLKESEAKDRHLAKVIMEQDFNKYNSKYDSRNKRVDEEDLLAIQQIEIDRGNYNSTEAQYIAPRKISNERQPKPLPKGYSNHSKPAAQNSRSKHSPKNSKERSSEKKDRRKDQKRPQNGRKAENISKEFRSPRREYKAPAQYQSRPEAAVAYFPADRRRDSDGGQSTESFGEFYNPKERSPMRRYFFWNEFFSFKIFRVKSLDSILDSESVCADGPGMTVRIKPGVYQKTPAVQLAESEAQR